ncbi:hypothetical protein LCGC14_1155290 [marine sediment metagenome]|uniref:Uncharacterized protein n=1 Tax=marine sediment metagenome TaxID=412755 RepID=A0A0F9LZ10_9ZZZZ
MIYPILEYDEADSIGEIPDSYEEGEDGER